MHHCYAKGVPINFAPVTGHLMMLSPIFSSIIMVDPNIIMGMVRGPTHEMVTRPCCLISSWNLTVLVLTHFKCCMTKVDDPKSNTILLETPMFHF